MTVDSKRLIEVAFPLKQTSLDSVHEKNVRHGHISTLHIWPARRPLAACRAALIATLLPDPSDKEERDRLLERLAGHVVQKTKKRKLPSGKIEEVVTEETEGGILHWGRESGPDLAWFREKIREAYGGRAPKVFDPFAGGGAIPLEAMRLGCEVTAVDINPVAWFILKCTLEYPQRLAGKTQPLPGFALADREFMEEYSKAQGLKGAALQNALDALTDTPSAQPTLFTDHAARSTQYPADLAWHVRAWGRWVLSQARRELAPYYPSYADFQPATKGSRPVEGYAPRIVPLCEDSTPDLDALNAEFSKEYLADPRNPRWVAKPTVAYLWARTVTCKSCRATVPLLKTRWLCKKDNKRVVLTMTPNPKRTGVVFEIKNNAPQGIGGAAQRREHDKRLGGGTMSRAGAICPCCSTIMTMEDIRLEGQAGRLGMTMTAVVVNGPAGKEYRLPTDIEIQAAIDAEGALATVFSDIPFGLPNEPTPVGGGSGASRAFSVQGYGLMHWYDLFTSRSLLALGTFVRSTRVVCQTMRQMGYSPEWAGIIPAYLALAVDRLADAGSTIAHWQVDGEFNVNTFQRFALPISWDFSEINFSSGLTGSYESALDWIGLAAAHFVSAAVQATTPTVTRLSATQFPTHTQYDLVLTDPPYYDAIPYSDAMDFFYVWLRRTLQRLSAEFDSVFAASLSPKWDHDANDGELIDDASRFGGDARKSMAAYEDGMARAFQSCYNALAVDGRLVVVFAHKQPDAWETLVSAIIRAGFVVDGSWPIQTERAVRTRSLGSAALSSSVWLVCKKRPETARPGWDKAVLSEMQTNIATRLRDFWDAGIRGPDFVWAATGPALEAYSKYPVVKKADEPGQLLTVTEFLGHVRRMVVDFVVGRVLSGGAEAAAGLDDATTYYLLHRNDFGMDDAPIGACILYAISCGLSDQELADRYDLLARTGSAAEAETEAEAEGEVEEEESVKGNTVRLKPWSTRKGKNLGYEGPGGRPAPLIDQVHRLMHLWRAGDVTAVDDYLEARGLRRNALFGQLLQALIELAAAGSEERALLESISNHVAARGTAMPGLFGGDHM